MNFYEELVNNFESVVEMISVPKVIKKQKNIKSL